MSTRDRFERMFNWHMGYGADNKISDEDDAHSLNLDSLDEIELIMCAEEEFDIVIHDEEAEAVTNVKSFVSLIESKINQ